MAKKKYTTVWMDLTPGDDPDIPIGGSQGSSGQDSQFSFSGFDEDHEYIIDLIEANCDDIELADMAAGDYVITYDEFLAWAAANEPYWWEPED